MHENSAEQGVLVKQPVDIANLPVPKIHTNSQDHPKGKDSLLHHFSKPEHASGNGVLGEEYHSLEQTTLKNQIPVVSHKNKLINEKDQHLSVPHKLGYTNKGQHVSACDALKHTNGKEMHEEHAECLLAQSVKAGNGKVLSEKQSSDEGLKLGASVNTSTAFCFVKHLFISVVHVGLVAGYAVSGYSPLISFCS